MTSDRPNYAPEIKRALVDVRVVCDRLGLTSGCVRQPRGLIIKCFVHAEKTASCSVQVRDGVLVWRCHGCDASGDVLHMIAAVRGYGQNDFKRTLIEGAILAGLWGIVDELEGRSKPDHRPRPVLPPPPPEPERKYPDAEDVAALWEACGPTAADPEVAAWLTSRGLDAETVDAGDLARAMPAWVRPPPWASKGGLPWTVTGHRLIVAMRDPLGAIRTVRGCRVIDSDTPKRLPPAGHKASGVVMVNELGIAMLAGTFAPERVVVVEGEPDFLSASTEPMAKPAAVVGIVSGSWTQALAERFPRNALVAVWTDADQAGERYAMQIVNGLRNRCHVRRWRPRVEAA